MDRVYVLEHGSAPRPAKVVRRYESSEQGLQGLRVVVEFVDERGGTRDCFARSVCETQAQAQEQQ